MTIYTFPVFSPPLQSVPPLIQTQTKATYQSRLQGYSVFQPHMAENSEEKERRVNMEEQMGNTQLSNLFSFFLTMPKAMIRCSIHPSF